VQSGLVRYAPHKRFPPYAFLPGRDPHPTRDPRGHSFGVEESPAGYWPADRWRENEPYLFGVDLYNHGFLWEAHEVWESSWHRAKHDADQADMFQGLIQCSAASLKIPMEQANGLKKLAEAGTGRLESVAKRVGPHFMGLDLWDFIHEFRAFAASEPRSADERPRIALS
jgi:hypothetical protein